MTGLRVFSSGGGWQSSAALVLSARGEIDYPVHLFCNVGDDSEHPATLAYVRDHLQPYADAHGIDLHELHRLDRAGEPTETLYQQITRPDSRSLPIPVRMSRTGMPGNRRCTDQYKIKVVRRWLREHGATADSPAVTGIGFSTDEVERIGNARAVPSYQQMTYPLVDLGLSRQDCYNTVRDAGLPPPPKSACWFCPYHRVGDWREMKRRDPELFDDAVALEQLLNERRAALGGEVVWLSSAMRPLPLVAGDGVQEALFDDDDGGCDSGHCWT